MEIRRGIMRGRDVMPSSDPTPVSDPPQLEHAKHRRAAHALTPHTSSTLIPAVRHTFK